MLRPLTGAYPRDPVVLTVSQFIIVPFYFVASFLSASLPSRCFLKQTETNRCEKFPELADPHRQNPSHGCGSGHDDCCAFDACWAHLSLLSTSSFAFLDCCSQSTSCRQIEALNLLRNCASSGHAITCQPQHARVSFWFLYSSWRRHQRPVSLRPFGARSSHGYMPQRASSPRA
jgi:hypothetical protein